MDITEALFFDNAPEALPLYGAVREMILSGCAGAGLRVQKTQITFHGRHVFACVSLPRRKVRDNADAHIIVTLGLGRRVDDPRVWRSVEPYPGRWTHHVIVKSIDEADGQLNGWIREAYLFSETK